MSTVEEIIKDIQGMGMRGFTPVACARWLDNRYRELVSRVKFKHLRKTGELSLPAIIDTGSVTATSASTTLTGSSTTWATAPGTGTQEHYFIKLNSTWHKIASIDSDTSLTLTTAFTGDSGSYAYKIAKRTHSLASDARWLGTFVHSRYWNDLTQCSEEELDISAPGRPLAGVMPRFIAEEGVDSNGYTKVEIYPSPAESELIHYVYWSLPTSLTLSSTIPQVIDAYVLKEGALIDAYLAAKIAELNLGNVDAAAVYSNSAKTQRTLWERRLQDALRTQKGIDDVSFIVKNFGGTPGTGDIRTARDQIFATWSK